MDIIDTYIHLFIKQACDQRTLWSPEMEHTIHQEWRL